MRGLDPRIHLLRKKLFPKGMDCRVKPGNDGGVRPGSFRFPSPLVGRGEGWGSFCEERLVHHRTTPLPTPPPQGGREQTEFVARTVSRRFTPQSSWTRTNVDAN